VVVGQEAFATEHAPLKAKRLRALSDRERHMVRKIGHAQLEDMDAIAAES
jgi:hypothetical protein